MDDIQKIIDILGLTPLSQEGGLFRSSYRSPAKADGRDMGSAIYFMLTGQGYSHLHRLCTDEVYHFYSGDPGGAFGAAARRHQPGDGAGERPLRRAGGAACGL